MLVSSGKPSRGCGLDHPGQRQGPQDPRGPGCSGHAAQCAKAGPVWRTDEGVCAPSPQTPSTQSQAETPLQSELLPELTGAAQSPAPEHVVSPPSTVDTAALSEEPLPGEVGGGAHVHLTPACALVWEAWGGRVSGSPLCLDGEGTDCWGGGGGCFPDDDPRVKCDILLPPHSSFNPRPSPLPQR